MKKVLALALTAMMSLSLFACGGGTTTPSAAPEAESAAAEEATPAAEEAAPEATEAEAPAEEAAAPEAAASSLEGKRLALVVKSTGNPFMERMADGFKKACEQLGAEAIVKAPDAPTVEAQMAMVDELITQQVDGIAIAANEFDALQNSLQQAMDSGIPVVSLDSAVNQNSRKIHINQADTQLIGETLVEAVYDIMGGSGEFAILSATSQASNQNAWIAVMEETLKDPKYADLKLVTIAYGDDLRDKSTSETEGLLKTYENLKCIVAPTTVGIAAASKVVQDQGVADKVKITGLGLPSEMAEYIESGTCPYMYLWNPIDLGYLAGEALGALATGQITGAEGEAFSGGDMGDYTITADPAGGTEVLMGPPFKFEPSNIADWKDVY